jgi:hypothetical protein
MRKVKDMPDYGYLSDPIAPTAPVRATGGLRPAKIAFVGASVVVVATAVVAIANLGTIADVIVEAASAGLFVVAGRKSRDWF